jgi:hypothetical protein
MKLVCPNNPKHKEFKGEMKIKESWRFDQQGKLIDDSVKGQSREVTGPAPKSYRCVICNVKAIKEG